MMEFPTALPENHQSLMTMMPYNKTELVRPAPMPPMPSTMPSTLAPYNPTRNGTQRPNPKSDPATHAQSMRSSMSTTTTTEDNFCCSRRGSTTTRRLGPLLLTAYSQAWSVELAGYSRPAVYRAVCAAISRTSSVSGHKLKTQPSPHWFQAQYGHVIIEHWLRGLMRPESVIKTLAGRYVQEFQHGFRSYVRDVLEGTARQSAGGTSPNENCVLRVITPPANGRAEVTDGWYACMLQWSPSDHLLCERLKKHSLVRIVPQYNNTEKGVIWTHSNACRPVRGGGRFSLGRQRESMPPLPLRDVIPWDTSAHTTQGVDAASAANSESQSRPPIIPVVDVIVLAQLPQNALWVICTKTTNVLNQEWGGGGGAMEEQWTMAKISLLRHVKVALFEPHMRVRLSNVGPDRFFHQGGPKLLFMTPKSKIQRGLPHPMPFNLPRTRHTAEFDAGEWDTLVPKHFMYLLGKVLHVLQKMVNPENASSMLPPTPPVHNNCWTVACQTVFLLTPCGKLCRLEVRNCESLSHRRDQCLRWGLFFEHYDADYDIWNFASDTEYLSIHPADTQKWETLEDTIRFSIRRLRDLGVM